MNVVALVGEGLAPAYTLAGMEVIIPADISQLKEEFAKTLNRHNVALIVISARFAIALEQEIEMHRLSGSSIMILEIASSKGDFKPGAKLQKFVREAIGQG
ncbi:MAG: V-type ATP synthase subunit F [Brevinema sp.]